MIDNEAQREELRFLVSSLKERLLVDRELGKPIFCLKKDQGSRHTKTAEVVTAAAPPEGTRPRGDVSVASSGEGLDKVRANLGDCRRCKLAGTRRHIVFGEGNPEARLVFVGEAPGADEDLQGKPFVGRAGQLLTRIIAAMEMRREDVYICNILKCRPPQNRNPLPDEIASCEPFLIAQLEAIRPRVICALGSFAAHALLKSDVPITVLRGHFHDYQGIPLMPTYHPAYLLRNPAAKKQVWEDVKKIMELLAKSEDER